MTIAQAAGESDLVASSIAHAIPEETVEAIHFERAVLRRDHWHHYYRVAFLDGLTGPIRPARVVAKFEGADRARSAHEAASYLWNAGFRPPSRWRVPRPLGYSKHLGASWQEVISDASWLDHLSGDDRAATSASTLAAEWLAALHTLGPPARTDTHDQPSLVAAASSLPTGGLVELASELSSELSRSEEPLVASHGDYHPKNVLSDGSTISVIDLDKLAEREASFDCGDAIAQLLIMSYYTFSSTERGMIAARAFWRRYARLSGASPTRTAMHICRAVIHALAFKHALGLRAQSPVPGLAEWTSLVVAVADDRDPESIIEKSAALAT